MNRARCTAYVRSQTAFISCLGLLQSVKHALHGVQPVVVFAGDERTQLLGERLEHDDGFIVHVAVAVAAGDKRDRKKGRKKEEERSDTEDERHEVIWRTGGG